MMDTNQINDLLEIITIYLNRIWFVQTTICLLFCIYAGRLKPVKKMNYDFKQESIFILQFLLVLVINTIIYLIELTLVENWTNKLDMCLHHLLGVCIFVQTIKEPFMICSIFLPPYLIHTIYKGKIIGNDDILLWIYLSSFSTSFLYLINSKNISKQISLKIHFLGFLIIFVNLFWYFHGQDFNIYQFHILDAVIAMLKSLLLIVSLILISKLFYSMYHDRWMNSRPFKIMIY